MFLLFILFVYICNFVFVPRMRAILHMSTTPTIDVTFSPATQKEGKTFHKRHVFHDLWGG